MTNKPHHRPVLAALLFVTCAAVAAPLSFVEWDGRNAKRQTFETRMRCVENPTSGPAEKLAAAVVLFNDVARVLFELQALALRQDDLGEEARVMLDHLHERSR